MPFSLALSASRPLDIYIYTYVCISVVLSLSLSLSLSLCVAFSMYLSIHLSIYIYLYLGRSLTLSAPPSSERGIERDRGIYRERWRYRDTKGEIYIYRARWRDETYDERCLMIRALSTHPQKGNDLTLVVPCTLVDARCTVMRWLRPTPSVHM